MKIAKSLKVSALLVAGGVLLSLSAQTAHAQRPGGVYYPGYFDSVDTVGGGFDYGAGTGQPDITVTPGSKAPRFGSPSASQVSTSVEFEKWGAEFPRYSGNRTTYLLSYQRELQPGLQGQVILPYQRLYEHSGFAPAADGFSDTELDLRKTFANTKNPDSPTIIASLRGFVPTGNWEKGIGLHQWGIGPSVLVSKPFNTTLGYAGLGYTAFKKYNTHYPGAGKPANGCPWYYWAGGATELSPLWMTQYELLGFMAPNEEQYVRGLIGVRYGITPSMGIQVNFKKELRARGKAETLSIGWSDLF